MDEERKKRLEDLKQQSLELEKEAAEREKKNEERKKAREEQQRLAAEQEKKDEEERIKKREERRKKREEDERILKEEMEKLESEKANRGATSNLTSPKTPSSITLSPSNSSFSISSTDGNDSPSSTSALSAASIAAKEEREKRRKELEEETKQLELEQQKVREEREKRKEERRLQQEEENRKLQELLDKKELEKQEREKEKQQQQQQQDNESLEKEKKEKEQKDKEAAAILEKERLEKEQKDKEAAQEKERLEKEQKDKEEAAAILEKEQKDKEAAALLEKEKQEKEEKERLENQQKEKEAAALLEKEKQEKEAAEAIEKERLEKEAAALLKKEKQEKEAAEASEKERLEKEQKDKEEARLEKEQKQKEEAKVEKERLEKEQKEKEAVAEKQRLEKEQKEKEAAAEKERLEKEKRDKVAAEKERLEKEQQKEKQEKEALLEKQRLEKEQKDKEAAQEKEQRQKEEAVAAAVEKERLEKEKKDKELKEKQEKEVALEKERLEKEKKAKELKEKEAALEKERLEKEKKAKELKEKQEKELKEKEQKEQKESQELSKSVDKDSKSSSITNQFKLSIEKQLQNQLENKKKPSAVTEDTSTNSPAPLSSLTKDRVKIKGRQAPSKSHKAPGSSTTTDDSNNEPSLLSKALESNSNNNDSPSSVKKKIILPPGVGGIMGSMASLAMEAQKKKMEIDNNKLLSNVLKEEAPSFVRGRSQSVSVTSTLKQEPGKFVQHKKTVDTYSGLRARLIHCKGKKRILTKEVEISINSLNKCDAFVLDCGIEGSNVGGESVDSSSHSTIFTWYGSKSTANKKAKAVAIAEIIKSHERGGHATIIKLDEGDDNELFYKRLNGTHKSNINVDGGDDLEAELNWASSFTLLKYEIESDQLYTVDAKSLSMELLASDGFYVLDTVTEFYEWSGRNADQSLKDAFHIKSQERLKNNPHRQTWVESVILSEGGETVLFREKFFDWPDLSHEVSLQRMGFGKKRVFDVSIPYEKRSPLKMNQFEVREMVEIERAEEVLKSDGSGSYEIWFIDQCKLYPLPLEEYGHFFSGSCYLIRYQYTKWNAIKHAIYYWQGADASRQDVGSSSLLSKDLYIETSARGECSQDPERMGRESNHFLSIFNGKMVVHRGDRLDKSFGTSSRLYHVFGKKPNTNIATQTTRLSGTCLNSRDCFIVTAGAGTVVYTWESKGSTTVLKQETLKLASLIVDKLKTSTGGNQYQIKTIKEGSETPEFWKSIGGDVAGKYANHSFIHESVPTDWENQIKLFAIVNTGSIIRADEIYRFTQYDLTISKVYILDNRKNIFVWSGLRAQEKEKKRGMEIAIDYVKYLSTNSNDTRTENDVLFITQGEEPNTFTSFFYCWDTFRLSSNVNNNSNGSSTNNDGADETTESGSAAVNLLKKYYQVLPFEKLIEKNTPPEIDRSVLEMYLCDEEFEKHLGCSKSEWEAMPAWKKTEKKKTSGLF